MGLFSRVYQENKNVVLDLLEPNGRTMLDVGCADGSFSKQISKRVGAEDCHGVEILEEQIRKSKQKGINVKKFDLNKKFEFKSNFFDVVVANQILEHLHDTDNFAKEIYRVLRPGGYAIISTPNLASAHNIFSLALGLQPFPASVSNEVILGNFLNPEYMKQQTKGGEHLRLFTLPALSGFFSYHGFKIESVKGVGFYPFPKVISRLLGIPFKRYSVYLTIKVRK